MKVVGLTGGVGSGKSTVASMFQQLGALVMDADQFAQQLTRPGEPVLEKIIQHFGAGFLTQTGELNRQALADLVFNDSEQLKTLNQIVHPEVRKLQQKTALEWQEQHPKQLKIYNVPLLFETGLDNSLSPIVVVWAPIKLCVLRLQCSRGWSARQARARIRQQQPLQHKAQLADFCILNAKNLKQTWQQVKVVYSALQRLNRQGLNRQN